MWKGGRGKSVEDAIVGKSVIVNAMKEGQRFYI